MAMPLESLHTVGYVPTVANQSGLREIAVRFQSLLRKYDGFSLCKTRLEEYLSLSRQNSAEKIHRKQNRIEVIKTKGVLYNQADLPSQPGSGWEFETHIFRGTRRLKVPPEVAIVGLFGANSFARAIEVWMRRLAIQCPDTFRDDHAEEDGFEYEFCYGAWIPPELSDEWDPDTRVPLPLPDRPLKLQEKYAVLSAIRDRYWKGGDLVDRGKNKSIAEELWDGIEHVVMHCSVDDVPDSDVPIIEDLLFEIEADLKNAGDPAAGMDTLNPPNSPHESAGETDVRYGFLGGRELREVLGVHPTRANAFEQQLNRKRRELGDSNWHEVHDPLPNSPRYLYKSDSPTLLSLAQKYQSPNLG